MFSLPYINEPNLELALGITTGLVLSLILGYMIIKTTLKLNINLNIIFSVVSLILIFVGGEMFGEGLYKVFPAIGEAIQTAGQLVFTLPLLFLFLKREIKRYI
jgi:high-affinity iron transporter